MENLKYRKSWKYNSRIGKELNPLVVIKPKVLSFWEQERVNMPVRSYERYPVSKAIKSFLPGREFGYDDSLKDTTEQYQKFQDDHKKKFDDYAQRPSKYVKSQKFLPSILLAKDPFYLKKSDFEAFDFPKHNTFIYENKFRVKNK